MDHNAPSNHAESNNSSPNTYAAKDKLIGPATSSIKYVVPRSTSSLFIYLKSNKSSTGEVVQPLDLVQELPPPAGKCQPSQQYFSRSNE
ncbi:hypothetical protein RYX36_008304 [Vicia faba]